MARFARGATLTGFAELAQSLGLDPIRLAAEVELPPEAFTDPDLKIPTERVGRLMDLAASRSGSQDIGVRLAESRRLSNLGPVGLIVRDQPSLRKALEVMRQYLWLHSEGVSFVLEEMDDIAIARHDFSRLGGRPSRQGVEQSVGVMCASLRGLIGRLWRPEAVMFRHAAPKDLSSHRRLFGVTPEFRQDFDGLVLRRADLDAPLPAADPDMARQVQRYVDHLARGGHPAWRETVGDMIVLLLPTGQFSADRIAQRLGFDRRTLHRRLAEEGCSYRHLLADRRAELCAALIAEGRSFAEIADLAGFSSLSTLSHWFSGRFGRSPKDYRASLT